MPEMITIPYPPSVNHIWRTVNGRPILSSEGRKYKEAVKKIALTTRVAQLDGDVEITMRVYRPRRIGDLDNTFKATQDALKGILWADDKQIVRIVAERYDDKHNPRVEIEARLIDLRITK